MPETLHQPDEDRDLRGVAWSEVGVAALGRADAVARPVPVEQGLAEAGPGRDERGVSPDDGGARIQDLQLVGRERRDAVGRRLEVVQEDHALEREHPSQGGCVDHPAEVRHPGAAVGNGPGDPEAGRHGNVGTVAEKRGWMGNDLLNAFNTAVGAGIAICLGRLV